VKIANKFEDESVTVRFDTIDEARAVISGLDSDRNHPARSELYLGLINAIAEKRIYWRGLAAFSNVVFQDEYSRARCRFKVSDA
jgi:hypothetical protein